MTQTLWGEQIENTQKTKPKKSQSKPQPVSAPKEIQVYDLDIPTDYDNPMPEQEEDILPRQRQALSVPDKLIEQAQSLGLELSVKDGDLLCTGGNIPTELAQALQDNKEWIIIILSLPTPAKPGEELEQLRREIGEIVQERQEKRAA